MEGGKPMRKKSARKHHRRRNRRKDETPRGSLVSRIKFLTVVVLCAMTVVYCSSKEYIQEPMFNVASERKPIKPQPKEMELPPLDFKNAFFAFDKAILTDAGKKALKPTADWMKKHTEVTIQIEGYCDEKGSEQYNMVLGEKRAKAAKDFFVSQGVDSERIQTVSYGRVEGSADDIRAKNRRVGIVAIFPQQPEPELPAPPAKKAE